MYRNELKTGSHFLWWKVELKETSWDPYGMGKHEDFPGLDIRKKNSSNGVQIIGLNIRKNVVPMESDRRKSRGPKKSGAQQERSSTLFQ